MSFLKAKSRLRQRLSPQVCLKVILMARFRSYRDLSRFGTFEERFEYLRLNGAVAHATFGSHRGVNQAFYTSREWKRARDWAISRDNGCDLGIPGYEIHHELVVHHITPLTLENVLNGDECLFDLDNLITTTLRTHNGIHYGDVSLLPPIVAERTRGDTKLW